MSTRARDIKLKNIEKVGDVQMLLAIVLVASITLADAAPTCHRPAEVASLIPVPSVGTALLFRCSTLRHANIVAIQWLLDRTPLERLGLPGVAMHPDAVSESQPTDYVVLTIPTGKAVLPYAEAVVQCVVTLLSGCNSTSPSVSLNLPQTESNEEAVMNTTDLSTGGVTTTGEEIQECNITFEGLIVTVWFSCEGYIGILETYLVSVDMTSKGLAKEEANCNDSILIRVDYPGNYSVQVSVELSGDAEMENRIVCSRNFTITDNCTITDNSSAASKAWIPGFVVLALLISIIAAGVVIATQHKKLLTYWHNKATMYYPTGAHVEDPPGTTSGPAAGPGGNRKAEEGDLEQT